MKSKPEVWSEVSDVSSLARHLGAFGEIAITRVTPETAVAWEGDRVRGTVTLERAGWGTKVTVTAEAAEGSATPNAERFVEPEATAEVTEVKAPEVFEQVAAEPEAEPKLRWWQRLAQRWRERTAGNSEALAGSEASNAAELPPVEPEAKAAPEPAPEPEPEPELREDAEEILNSMLDHIGAAHHRPFSRG